MKKENMFNKEENYKIVYEKLNELDIHFKEVNSIIDKENSKLPYKQMNDELKKETNKILELIREITEKLKSLFKINSEKDVQLTPQNINDMMKQLDIESTELENIGNHIDDKMSEYKNILGKLSNEIVDDKHNYYEVIRDMQDIQEELYKLNSLNFEIKHMVIDLEQVTEKANVYLNRINHRESSLDNRLDKYRDIEQSKQLEPQSAEKQFNKMFSRIDELEKQVKEKDIEIENLKSNKLDINKDDIDNEETFSVSDKEFFEMCENSSDVELDM